MTNSYTVSLDGTDYDVRPETPRAVCKGCVGDTNGALCIKLAHRFRCSHHKVIFVRAAKPDFSQAFGAATPPMPETKAAPAQPNLALPEDSVTRKEMPMATGLLDYFPAALAEVARVSKKGNDKHNPGQPLHHARGKSMDHPDCIMRHLADRGLFDDQGMRHSANLAWRALALLQQELEDAGLAQPPRGAKFSD